MKINKKNSKKRIIIISAIGILLIAGALAAYFVLIKDADQQNSESTSSRESRREDSGNRSEENGSENSEDVNQGSAPAEDRQNAREQPQNTDQPPAAPVDESSGKQQLQLFVQHDIGNGNVNIRGGINNVIVRDGNCAATLRGPNGQVIEKPTTLLANPSTTDCRTIAIPLSELTPGNWRYTLHYTSPSAEGASDEKTFTIQ